MRAEDSDPEQDISLPSPRVIRPGERARLLLPHSEVCMHMRVAGRVMEVELTTGQYPMAQIFDDDGSPFSFPVATGEAGIHGSQHDGFHCYPVTERHLTAEEDE